MTTATSSTARRTQVLHPHTGLVVEITGRWKMDRPGRSTVTLLRVSGGCHFSPSELKLV